MWVRVQNGRNHTQLYVEGYFRASVGGTYRCGLLARSRDNHGLLLNTQIDQLIQAMAAFSSQTGFSI